MATDPDLRARFLAGMSRAAATVNVVTTDGPAGRSGVTVSAMSSVSADTPRPTLLVCVHRDSPSAAAILENRVFCVNLLRDDQSYVSDIFAGRFREQVADKFDCANWQPMQTGAPRLVDPLVAFDCTVVSDDLVGTHHVFFGEVADIFIADRGSPLVYANRAYGATSRIDAVATIGAGRDGTRNDLRLACFYTISPFMLPTLFGRLRAETPDSTVTLVEGDQSRLLAALYSGESDLALMYDESLPDDLAKENLVERSPHVVIAADHPLARQDEISAQDLADTPMILLNTPPSPDYFLGILRENGVEPTIAYQSAAIETVRSMVGAGLGYTLLASRPRPTTTYAGHAVVTRPLPWPARPSRVMLVRRAETPLPPAAERFARHCREIYQAPA